MKSSSALGFKRAGNLLPLYKCSIQANLLCMWAGRAEFIELPSTMFHHSFSSYDLNCSETERLMLKLQSIARQCSKLSACLSSIQLVLFLIPVVLVDFQGRFEHVITSHLYT